MPWHCLKRAHVFTMPLRSCMSKLPSLAWILSSIISDVLFIPQRSVAVNNLRSQALRSTELSRFRPPSAFWRLSRLSSSISPRSLNLSTTDPSPVHYTSFPENTPTSWYHGGRAHSAKCRPPKELDYVPIVSLYSVNSSSAPRQSSSSSQQSLTAHLRSRAFDHGVRRTLHISDPKPDSTPSSTLDKWLRLFESQKNEKSSHASPHCIANTFGTLDDTQYLSGYWKTAKYGRSQRTQRKPPVPRQTFPNRTRPKIENQKHMISLSNLCVHPHLALPTDITPWTPITPRSPPTAENVSFEYKTAT